MKELNDIIQAYEKAVLQNKQTALATVVKVEGSSYRRPGARMLVTEDGVITGAVSGGCLEGDALKKAQFAMQQQQNKLEIYDTTDEGDSRLGVQLGCNGIVYILFEPVKQDDPNNPVQLLRKIAQHRKDAVLITGFNENKYAPQPGTYFFINEPESSLNNEIELNKEGTRVLETGETIISKVENNSVLFQFIPPAIQLLIMGAGNDAQPLTEMASILGWNIIVADGRQAHAAIQRFPKANKVSITSPADILTAAEIDDQTAMVIMTHNYNYDIAALQQIIKTNCRYIGLLGPKKKLHKMLNELKENDIAINDDIEKRIYSPVGLDIGAETPEEIALSVIAEIKAVFSQRSGSPLKERKTSIHHRV
ncbi:MAG TPA: XdhC/CoxI family protein [Chitinophagaceae bacterium]|nr:XdhC/CoxI family protein [Chitinophagaceae bacterium]